MKPFSTVKTIIETTTAEYTRTWRTTKLPLEHVARARPVTERVRHLEDYTLGQIVVCESEQDVTHSDGGVGAGVGDGDDSPKESARRALDDGSCRYVALVLYSC